MCIRNRSRKAQLEVLGLAIVVLLISLSLLFVLQFVVTRAPELPKQTFTRDQLASTMVSALLETTSHCAELTMTELIQDCAQQPLSDVDCNGDGDTRVGVRSESCTVVETVTQQIFAETLDKWQKSYEFSVKYGQTADPLVKVMN